VPVQIVDYEEESGYFKVHNKELNINTSRPRIYILLDTENEYYMLEAMRNTIRLKAESL
jgi:hypothetical protein